MGISKLQVQDSEAVEMPPFVKFTELLFSWADGFVIVFGIYVPSTAKVIHTLGLRLKPQIKVSSERLEKSAIETTAPDLQGK